MTVMREDVLRNRKSIIVKLGSMILAAPEGGVDQSLIDTLAAEMAALREDGYRFVIVSSGAILMGLQEMGQSIIPKAMKVKQALAAIGQSKLMHAYDEAFSRHGIKVGQMLLTREGLDDRKRFLNARNTLGALLRMGVIPVINENDSVAVEEIMFGDNDFLSSMVVNLTDADLLVIMTDTAGLYDRDPRLGEGRLIEVVEDVDERILSIAGGPGDSGSGGMSSKVMAAKRTARKGIPTVIADGRSPGNLTRILKAEPAGTLFLPARDKLASRKHWIAYSSGIKGTLVLDDGAIRAVVKGQKSLLPAGIKDVRGSFEQGGLVQCVDQSGNEVARGFSSFSADHIRLIMGKHSEEIREILGFFPGEEVIHRDDLVLKE
ncbi:glutamate 5-kinase [bacterium]|nr:MAG: glutamate 5-kinase [bacterium]